MAVGTIAIAAASLAAAIVTTDHAVLRGAPRDSAPQQAQLWQGEVLQVRGERLDYLQVWDPATERGGYVRASQVRRTDLSAQEAPELLAILRFLHDAPGAESLGIGIAAAYLQAAPPEALRGPAGAEALEALGTFAQRLAQRASDGAATSRQAQIAVSAHLEVAARYGVKFTTYQQDERMRICYDGEAFRRVLALPATAPQQARAALALTEPECMDPALQPLQLYQVDLWRAQVLERVDMKTLPPYLRSRVALRRASVWSTLAYEQARLGRPAQPAAEQALADLASVAKSEVAEDDQAAFNDAVMRVNASRWAAVPASPSPSPGVRPAILTRAGDPGQTCVLLVDAKHDAAHPLAQRCTYALVWPQSASVDREGNAAALAVQPLAAWRELWIFRKRGAQWAIETVPPGTLQPQLGYVEFAGWVPGGQQVLLAREARGEGRYRRSYEVVSLDSLATLHQSGDATALGAFQRWPDPAWKKWTVSVRD
jgi:hypothetical protein